MSVRQFDEAQRWVQAVCDGCGYVEQQYDGMGDSYSAVEASALGHYLPDWLLTNDIDLCPKCSQECSSCDGTGCEQCSYEGRTKTELQPAAG